MAVITDISDNLGSATYTVCGQKAVLTTPETTGSPKKPKKPTYTSPAKSEQMSYANIRLGRAREVSCAKEGLAG